MATTYGSAAPDFHSHALSYVAIPLAIVVGLGVVAMLLHTQRRKRLLKQQLRYVGPNPGARRVMERDIQDAWLRGAPHEERQRQRRVVRGRWSRTANPNGGGRWAWAREFLTSRGEEGLNEFGEAPPPYDGRRTGSKVHEEGDEVEMQVRPSGSGPSSGSGTTDDRSALRAEGSETGQSPDQQRRTSGQLGQPPAYETPVDEVRGGTAVAVPPPAVTHDTGPSRPSA
jgi:hypothetical protein